MPTSMPPSALSARLGAAALTVLTAAGASLLATPAAVAAPGDGADIRIHNERVPYGVAKDDPAVCRFYLDAANFGEVTSVAYTITAQPPLPTAATVSGTISLAGGAGHTDVLGLADGRYTLTWTFTPALPGATPITPKAKVFTVDCHRRDPDRGQQGPSRTIEDHSRQGGVGGDGGPRGGVHAGGGGLVDTVQAYTPLSGAAAVGLVAVGGVVYVRLRRRNDGAA
ncbi:hypothetical protein ACFY1L_19110 [Streptomyces sp. NPDC001663]|uniref:hypothetical protein n=1 Tax=Streptomyces sp. NPDC001663 TaxID=3364597 RepID=UPI0036A4A0DC